MYQVDQYVCMGGDTEIRDSTVMYLNSSQGSFSASRINTSASAYLPTDYFDFEDECLEYNDSFLSDTCYFLKCYIKRIYNDQIFNIKLRQYDDQNPSIKKEQYIKTITIPKWKEEASASGLSHEWDCIELFFNPAKDNFFNAIVFELNRDAIEFTGLKTYPKIIYSEIAELSNLNFVATNEIIKFGLQAKPNFLFCLNNEEMRVSSNGIYELRNTAIPIDFLSIPPDNTHIGEIFKLQIDNDFRNAYRKWSENKNKEQAIEALSAIQSKVITLDSSSFTNVNYDPFIIDYIYRVEGGSENA